MKKFFLYTLLVLVILGSIFAYLLYSEGAFEHKDASNAKPFVMKCGAGKCGANMDKK